LKRFILKQDFLDIFPEAQIGVLLCRGIDNHVKEEDKYVSWLRECEKLSAQYTENPEFTSNPVIRGWRDAFYKFKTKKGARCSIEALLKRVAKGNQIGTIIPLVDIYNGISFKPSPMEEILEDIDAIASKATALTRRIYLTGGNPFALSNRRLLEIFDSVEERIPTVNSYGGFCRITDIAHKSDEELAELAARGVNDLAIGAESGHDETLAFMQKGQTANDLVEQARRLHEAGIDFTFFYLAGLAGLGKGEANALASADTFSIANGTVNVIIKTNAKAKIFFIVFFIKNLLKILLKKFVLKIIVRYPNQNGSFI